MNCQFCGASGASRQPFAKDPDDFSFGLRSLYVMCDRCSRSKLKKPRSQSRSTRSANSSSISQELKELHDLYQQGIISAAEFEAAKRKLLG